MELEAPCVFCHRLANIGELKESHGPGKCNREATEAELEPIQHAIAESVFADQAEDR